MLSFFNRVIARIWAIFHSSEFDRELDAELESHAELRTEDLIRQGMQPEKAKRAARIELGGVTQLHEAHRDARGLPFVGNVLTDCGYVLRQLGDRERGKKSKRWWCGCRKRTALGAIDAFRVRYRIWDTKSLAARLPAF